MEVKITGVDEKDAEAIKEVIDKIAQNKDAIVQLLDVVEKLKETGALTAISALAEGFEEGFNAVVKPELMGSIANIMMMVWLIGNIDHTILFELAQKAPEGINKSWEEFQKTKEEGEKPSLLKILKMMRSPEFFAVMKAIYVLLSHIGTNGRNK